MKTFVNISLVAVGIASLTACDWLSNDKPQSPEVVIAPIDSTAIKPDSLANDSSKAGQPEGVSQEKAN